MFTQTPITKILPPPDVDDTVHHIWFVSSHIKNRIVAAPMSQDFHLIPVGKYQGTLRFCIDFREIPNLHATIRLLDDTQPLEKCLVQLELVDESR